MKWIKSSVKIPIENSIKREISTNEIIPNNHIYRQESDRIVMDNDYDSVGINGREIMFNDIEWLDEELSSSTEQEFLNIDHSRKNIKTLTEDDANDILKFIFPDDKYINFIGISFEPKILEDGGEEITFGARSIIGIEYHNGQDRCILHFNNSKVVFWLYKNGYEIIDLLKQNLYFSQLEKDFENFSFAIDWMSKGEDGFKENVKKNWTLEYVTNKCKELLNKYYYKDYD